MTTTKESYDQDVAAERQRCIKIVHEWLNGLVLRAGKMTMQEKRTALAIVAAISVAIHDGKKE